MTSEREILLAYADLKRRLLPGRLIAPFPYLLLWRRGWYMRPPLFAGIRANAAHALFLFVGGAMILSIVFVTLWGIGTIDLESPTSRKEALLFVGYLPLVVLAQIAIAHPFLIRAEARRLRIPPWSAYLRHLEAKGTGDSLSPTPFRSMGEGSHRGEVVLESKPRPDALTTLVARRMYRGLLMPWLVGGGMALGLFLGYLAGIVFAWEMEEAIVVGIMVGVLVCYLVGIGLLSLPRSRYEESR
jgi:hypothetical protein